MYNPVKSIVARAVKSDRLNKHIITFPTHASWEGELCKTKSTFFAYRAEGIIPEWNPIRPKPDNYILLNPELGLNQIPRNVDYDAVLVQNSFAHYPHARKIADMLHLPIICVTHIAPPPNADGRYIKYVKDNFSGDQNIFITHWNRENWGWREDENCEVIHHAIDTNIFQPLPEVEKKSYVLSVVNDFRGRDWAVGYTLWEQVTQGLPRLHVGKDPGFSEPTKTTEELVYKLNEAQVFINTSLKSPVPTSVLERAAAGGAIVTTNTCALSEIFHHRENCYMFDPSRPDLGRKYVERLLNDPEECARIGRNAREMIKEKFSVDKFVDSWNKVFHRAANTPYRGI